jgi:hypothetical protein
MLFIGLGLFTIIFLKVQYEGPDEYYEPTISLNQVGKLSNVEIVEKLFTMYLEHYKAKPIFYNQRIKDYTVKNVSEVDYVTDGTAFSVSYLVKQHLWNDGWEIGSRYSEGGMVKKFVYVSLIKEKEQFKLKIKGLEPPDPK